MAALVSAAALQTLSLDTGLDVLRTCQDRDYRMLCYGYLRGLTDGTSLMGELYGKEGAYCLPGSITMEETRRVVVQDLEVRRDLWSVNGIAAVIIVLRTSFPCS